MTLDEADRLIDLARLYKGKEEQAGLCLTVLWVPCILAVAAADATSSWLVSAAISVWWLFVARRLLNRKKLYHSLSCRAIGFVREAVRLSEFSAAERQRIGFACSEFGIVAQETTS